MPNQIEKLITALEGLIEKDVLSLEDTLITIRDREQIYLQIGTSQLLKILHAHKFLLEGVEKVHDGKWCSAQRDDLLKKYNEMI